jgi:hypothetical protein
LQPPLPNTHIFTIRRQWQHRGVTTYGDHILDQVSGTLSVGSSQKVNFVSMQQHMSKVSSVSQQVQLNIERPSIGSKFMARLMM